MLPGFRYSELKTSFPATWIVSIIYVNQRLANIVWNVYKFMIILHDKKH